MWEEIMKMFSLSRICQRFLYVTDNILKIAFFYFLKQLKNATDRLDQEDNALRAVLKEINSTFSIKVKLNGSDHPSITINEYSVVFVYQHTHWIAICPADSIAYP